MGDQAFFLRADGSDNDHDLGLFSVGDRAAAPHSVGLYHLAWQVHTLEDLVALRARLAGGRLARGRERPRRQQEPVREGPRRHRVRGHVGRAPRRLARPTSAPGGSTSTRARSAGPASTPPTSRRPPLARQLSSAANACVEACGCWNCSRLLQHRRQHLLPGEQQRVGQLAAQQQLRAERRHRQHRRAVQHLCPASWRSSALVTGFGAVRFTGPLTSAVSRCWIAPTSSGSEIQLCHCWPLPNRPPTNNLNSGSIFFSAPPLAVSTMPVRRYATRVPAAAAGAAAASHCSHTSARNPVAGG